jgi:hypothetical protein
LTRSFNKLEWNKVSSNLEAKRKESSDVEQLPKIQFLNCETTEDVEDILNSKVMTEVTVLFDGMSRYTINVTKFQSALMGKFNNHIKVVPKETVDVDVISKSIDYENRSILY